MLGSAWLDTKLLMFYWKCGLSILITAIFGYFSMGGGDLSEYIPMLIGVSIYKAPNVEYQLTKQVLQILELLLNKILS